MGGLSAPSLHSCGGLHPDWTHTESPTEVTTGHPGGRSQLTCPWPQRLQRPLGGGYVGTQGPEWILAESTSQLPPQCTANSVGIGAQWGVLAGANALRETPQNRG